MLASHLSRIHVLKCADMLKPANLKAICLPVALQNPFRKGTLEIASLIQQDTVRYEGMGG
jgi:hypothetical protein